MSPCDVRNLVRWAVISLVTGGLFAAAVLFYSDRLTEQTASQAHKTVVENQQEIRFLEAQIDQMRDELRACIEKR